jgi:hypothetical protein
MTISNTNERQCYPPATRKLLEKHVRTLALLPLPVLRHFSSVLLGACHSGGRPAAVLARARARSPVAGERRRRAHGNTNVLDDPLQDLAPSGQRVPRRRPADAASGRCVAGSRHRFYSISSLCSSLA